MYLTDVMKSQEILYYALVRVIHGMKWILVQVIYLNE